MSRNSRAPHPALSTSVLGGGRPIPQTPTSPKTSPPGCHRHSLLYTHTPRCQGRVNLALLAHVLGPLPSPHKCSGLISPSHFLLLLLPWLKGKGWSPTLVTESQTFFFFCKVLFLSNLYTLTMGLKFIAPGSRVTGFTD